MPTGGDGFDKWGRDTGGDGDSQDFDKWGRPVGPVRASGGGGGGGFFGHDFFGSRVLGSSLGLVGNLGRDLKDTGFGLPGGLVGAGKAISSDVGTFLTSGKPWWLQERPSATYSKLIKPAADAYRYQYGPLAGGDFGEFGHRLYEHPLGPILDVSAIFTGGAGAGARVGRAASLSREVQAAGAAGSRTGRLSQALDRGQVFSRYAEGIDSPRTLRSAVEQPSVSARGVVEGPAFREAQFARSRTPLGRLINRFVDTASQQFPDTPLIGATSRIDRKNTRVRVSQEKSIYTAASNAFHNAASKLDKDDRFAYHLAHEGVDPAEAFADALHTYQTEGGAFQSWQMRRYLSRLAGKSWKDIERITAEGGDAMAGSRIAERVHTMTPELLKALGEGKALEEKAGQTLIELGVLDPAVREMRKWLSQRVRSGARFLPEQNLAVRPGEKMTERRAELTSLRKLAQRGVRSAERQATHANTQAERLSAMRAKRGSLPEAPDVAIVRKSQEARDQAQARLQTAKERYYGKDAVIEGRQPVKEAKAAVVAAEAQLRKAEREWNQLKAQARRQVDFYERARAAYIATGAHDASSSSKRARAAYNRMEHAKKEQARIDERISAALRERQAAVKARDAAEKAHDEARRAGDVVRQREQEMVAADRGHAQLRRTHARAVKSHEVRSHQHERLARIHEQATRRAGEASVTQAEAAGVLKGLDDELRGIEEDIAWEGHTPPVSLEKARREGGLIGEDVGYPTGYTGATPGNERTAGVHNPAGLVGGTPVEELSLRRWLEVKGLEPAAVDPRAGFPSRFPHEASEKRPSGITPQGARQITRPIDKPKATKWNKGVRLRTARFATDPKVVLTRDYLRAMTFDLLVSWRDYHAQYAVDLDPSYGDGLLPDHVYFFADQKTRVPRSVKEADPLARDKLATDIGASQREVEQISKRTVWPARGKAIRGHGRTLHDGIQPSDFEGKTVAELAALGVKQIPERYAKTFLSESKASHDVVRLLFDKPTDMWRALVLKYRPAWLVNNIVGQHVLYGLSYGGPEGARSYLQALQTEKVPGETIPKLWRISIAARQWKYARVIDEEAPGLLFGTFYRSQIGNAPRLFMGDTRIGAYIDELGDAPWLSKRAPEKAGRVAFAAAAGVLTGFGDMMGWLNLNVADDLPRRAAFLSEMKRDPAIKRIRAFAKQAEGASIDLAEAIRRLGRGDPSRMQAALDRIDQALGNFTDMNGFEKAFVRRAVPFYSWFKVITKVSLRLPVESPLRVRLVQLAGQSPAAEDVKLPFPVPSYLRGAFGIGDPSGGEQTVVTTSAINPFSTPVQLFEGLFQGKGGTASPIQTTNPFFQALVTSLTGKDLFYGGDYKGPFSGAPGGLVYPGRALGYFAGLPQYRLGEQLGAYGNYESKLYNPNAETGVPGTPLSLNNYIWNYLGLPVKRVRISEARSRARAGQ